MTRTGIGAACVAALLLVLVGCGGSTGGSDSSLRVEDKLSAMFGGHQDDIGAALDVAARNCPEDRDRIADYVTYMMQELDEKNSGHGENALSVASAIADSAGAAPEGMECSEVAATLLVLMLPNG